ncbi:MAG: hypothetical protein P4M15_02810 [Alphaproteobacteria bacterium]|nr:hypothetical protein [Alphaproteobacteria bacterium]
MEFSNELAKRIHDVLVRNANYDSIVSGRSAIYEREWKLPGYDQRDENEAFAEAVKVAVIENAPTPEKLQGVFVMAYSVVDMGKDFTGQFRRAPQIRQVMQGLLFDSESPIEKLRTSDDKQEVSARVQALYFAGGVSVPLALEDLNREEGVYKHFRAGWLSVALHRVSEAAMEPLYNRAIDEKLFGPDDLYMEAEAIQHAFGTAFVDTIADRLAARMTSRHRIAAFRKELAGLLEAPAEPQDKHYAAPLPGGPVAGS